MDHFQNNIDNRKMEMLRATLPYIPVSMQKFLNIYIGLEELFRAIRTITSNAVVCESTKNEKVGNMDELLKVLRGFCSDKENEMIDMFFNMNKIMSMYDFIAPLHSDKNTTGSSSNLDDIFRKFM